jgi:hypothetical protein
VYQHNNGHKEERHDHEPRVKRDYIGTASKGEGARENKKYLSKRETRQAATRLAQEPHWRKSLCGPRRA